MNLNHKSPNVSSGNLFDFLGEDDDVVMSEFIQEEECSPKTVLNRTDALYAANAFEEFFGSIERIDEYMRKVKMERMMDFPLSLPGMGPEEDLFSNFDIHPSEMEFTIVDTASYKFMSYMEIVTSAPVEKSIPGKSMKWVIKEKNTNMVVGMIRLGSPTINSKPRNDWLGSPLDSLNPAIMARFNASAIMGFNIVPTQPFGYNYLGGKLLAAICCSHFTRDALNKKYDSNFCMFETTSLYGSTKSASQYDGMKPFLRFNGLTDSNFLPLINDNTFRRLSAWFTDKNGGEPLVPVDASSRKLKTQTKMASIIKVSLKIHDGGAYKKFCQTYDNAKGLTERKRSFVSTYGYDNVPQYLNLETDTLIEKENYDRFSLENVIAWWRKNATKRYDKLKSEGRLRRTVETWNVNADDIDIIR